MSEKRDDIVVLVDENGVETDFEVLDIIEYEENNYAVMLPAEDDGADEEEGVVTIMRIEEGEDDEDLLVPVESDDVLDNVFEIFKENMEDEFEFED